jgi:uncharacterized membrane protein (UPF0127 family)
MRRLWVVAAVLALGGVPACGSSGAAHQPTVSARGYPLGDLTVSRAGHSLLGLTVEIATDRTGWDKGLMGVKSLAADQGMAFVFPQPVTYGFWMKDTLIPLDIAFWDAHGHVVDVQHMVPCTADPCQIYYAAGAYSSAVETRGGGLAAAGVRSGDTVLLARRSTAVATGHP